MIATTNEKTPREGDVCWATWRLVADELESVWRRHNHQRASVVPGDVNLMPSVLASSVACHGDDGSKLSDLDRVGIVGHCEQPNAGAFAWSSVHRFDSAASIL